MTRRSEPVRTCVGCRQRDTKSDLVRVVAVGADLKPDPRGLRPGRGAHLHLDLDCLATAERRRAFPRALRVPGPLDAAELRQHITQLIATSTTTEGRPPEPPTTRSPKGRNLKMTAR